MTGLRRCGLVFLAMVLSFGLLGCQDGGGEPTLGVCLPPAGEGWEGSLLPAARAALEAWGGASQVAAAASIPGALGDAAEELIAQKADVVVMYASSPQDGLAAAARLAEEKIPLVLVGNPLEGATYDLLVTVDNQGIGKAAAEAIAARLDGQGTVLELAGPEGATTALRSAGFAEAIAAYPGIEVVATEAAGNERGVAEALTEVYLEQFPELGAVYAHSDELAMGAIAVLESQYADVQIVIGVGGTAETLDLLVKNHRYLKATWLYTPEIAGEAVRQAAALLAGEAMPEDRLVLLPLQEVTALNAQEVLQGKP